MSSTSDGAVGRVPGGGDCRRGRARSGHRSVERTGRGDDVEGPHRAAGDPPGRQRPRRAATHLPVVGRPGTERHGDPAARSEVEVVVGMRLGLLVVDRRLQPGPALGPTRGDRGDRPRRAAGPQARRSRGWPRGGGRSGAGRGGRRRGGGAATTQRSSRGSIGASTLRGDARDGYATMVPVTTGTVQTGGVRCGPRPAGDAVRVVAAGSEDWARRRADRSPQREGARQCSGRYRLDDWLRPSTSLALTWKRTSPAAPPVLRVRATWYYPCRPWSWPRSRSPCRAGRRRRAASSRASRRTVALIVIRWPRPGVASERSGRRRAS